MRALPRPGQPRSSADFCPQFSTNSGAQYRYTYGTYGTYGIVAETEALRTILSTVSSAGFFFNGELFRI